MIIAGGNRIGGIAFTVALCFLIAVATTTVTIYLAVTVLAIIAGGAAFFMIAFPGSSFFSIALANSTAIYASIFIFFVESNFAAVPNSFLFIGFVLPLVGLYGGAWLKRDEIRSIVTAHHLREERRFGSLFGWLAPVAAVGATTFALPQLGLSEAAYEAVFLVDMAVIGAVVFLASRDVSTFLIDTGILFEGFFTRVGHLLVPAFAFVTFYSLNVIVFAAFYRIADRFIEAPQFLVNDRPVSLSFADALYFSLMTVSTVGFGDIVPASNLVRALAIIQVMLGVLLLLFGVYEIITYARERMEHIGRQDG
jgi:voltage-gated potassium channel